MGSRRHRTSWSTAGCTGTRFFENAYSGGGFTLGAGYVHPMGCITGSMHAAAGRSWATSEPRLSSPPPSVPPPRFAVCPGWLARGDTGRLLWPGPGHVDRRCDELRLPTAVLSGLLEFRPTRRFLMLAEAWSFPMVAASREGNRPIGRDRLHASDAAGTRRLGHLSLQSGHRRVRLAHLSRLLATGRLLRRHVPRLRGPRRCLRFPPDRLRSDPALSDLARNLGRFRSAAACRPRSTRTVSRFRSS